MEKRHLSPEKDGTAMGCVMKCLSFVGGMKHVWMRILEVDGVLHGYPHKYPISHHITHLEMQLPIYKPFVFCMAV